MKRIVIILALSAVTAAMSGCASGRVWVYTKATPPVSATHAIHNPEGKVVGPEGYRVVKHLKGKYTHWKIGYSIVELNNDVIDAYDLMCKGEKQCPERDDANSRMGIVNVEATTGLTTWWNVFSLGTGTWVPFVPTDMKVRVEGDLVEFK